jgi:outer membrane protein OmpA-like peptidoglycan-associated protein
MRDPELELELELEDLMAVLSESELEEEIEGEIPQAQPQDGDALTCRPPIVLNGFPTGEYTLRTQHYARLLAVPLGGPIILIRGHSDNQGSAATNAGISLSRAFEVLQWLTDRNGSSPIAGRVIIEGVGPAIPVASNATAAGRSTNRRVEIFLCDAPPPPPLIANATRIEMSTHIA